MRIALAQLNTVVGDLDGNRARILDSMGEARAAGADLVVFPELATTGYPPEDLLLRPGFVRAARASPIESMIRARLPSRSPTTMFSCASAILRVFASQSQTECSQ